MSFIDVYDEVKECEYKGEKYSVRDNGAIFRYAKGPKKRKLDEIWTFGFIDLQKGYKLYGGEAVHRIVATAFLGEPPTDKHVVDHIDTNKQNNRPENLRWVTRLENIILNDKTRQKLEYIFGCKIEEILADMSILRSKDIPPQFSWMREVSKEEAQSCLFNWNIWKAAVDKRVRMDAIRKLSFRNKEYDKSNYPLEPDKVSLDEYAKVLEAGKVFFKKEYFNEVSEFVIEDLVYNDIIGKITVATKASGGVKSSYTTEITISNGKFNYEPHSYFDPNSVVKAMTLAKGEEWTGGDTIDDYC